MWSISCRQKSFQSRTVTKGVTGQRCTLGNGSAQVSICSWALDGGGWASLTEAAIFAPPPVLKLRPGGVAPSPLLPLPFNYDTDSHF